MQRMMRKKLEVCPKTGIPYCSSIVEEKVIIPDPENLIKPLATLEGSEKPKCDGKASETA